MRVGHIYAPQAGVDVTKVPTDRQTPKIFDATVAPSLFFHIRNVDDDGNMNNKLQTTQRRMMRMIIQTNENIRKISRRERRRNRGRRTFTTPPAHPWTTRQSTSTKTSTSTKKAVAAATFASTKTQETVQKTNWSRGPTTKREQRTKRATCQQQPESRLWTFRQSQIYSRHARMIALHQAKKVPQKKEDWTRDGKTTCQTSIYNLIKPRETNNDLATSLRRKTVWNVMLWKVTSKEADSNNQHDPRPSPTRRRQPNQENHVGDLQTEPEASKDVGPSLSPTGTQQNQPNTTGYWRCGVHCGHAGHCILEWLLVSFPELRGRSSDVVGWE